MKKRIGMRALSVLQVVLLVSVVMAPTVSAVEILPTERSPDGSLKTF